MSLYMKALHNSSPVEESEQAAMQDSNELYINIGILDAVGYSLGICFSIIQTLSNNVIPVIPMEYFVKPKEILYSCRNIKAFISDCICAFITKKLDRAIFKQILIKKANRVQKHK
ncbi:hypothetical protein T06_13179 [Trichinella sp. T6]|nr:hypothetical protein T06_13179 [Trichinella sp. T6]